MPNPIPRNRSAGGRQPRRPVGQQVWQILPFRRPRENIRQPEPAPLPSPPQPRPRARHRATPDLPFRRPQENVRQPGSPPPQPRRPARHRATPGLPARWPQENIGQPETPTPPTPTRSGTRVAVGIILCAVAALVVWIAAPLSPSGTSAGSTATPPMNDHAGATAAGGNPPGAVGGQLAAPPSTLAGLDRGPTPEGGARGGHTGVPPAVGFPVAPVAKSQPVPAAQPAPPGEPANVADPGQRVEAPAVDQVQRQPVQPGKPGHAEQVPPRPPQAPPPSQPHIPSDAEAAQLRERLALLARKLAQHQQGSAPKVAPKVARPPAKAAPPQQTSQKRSGTGGQKKVNRLSGSAGPSTRSGSGSDSSSSSSSSGSGSGSSGSGSSGSGPSG